MATEEASSVTTEAASLAKWSSWIAALVGLWVLVSPFVLSGAITSGPAMWSNVAAGFLVVVLASYGAYEHRSAQLGGGAAEWSGWIAALAGLWILITPFALGGPITTGSVLWSNVIVGVIAAILAAYAGYALE